MIHVLNDQSSQEFRHLGKAAQGSPNPPNFFLDGKQVLGSTISLNRKQSPKVEKEMETEMEDVSPYEDFSFGPDSSPLEDFTDKYPFRSLSINQSQSRMMPLSTFTQITRDLMLDTMEKTLKRATKEEQQ